MRAKLLQSCLTLCNPMDYSPPDSPVHRFSKQEYWNGLPYPPPGDLPDPGIKPVSLMSPKLADEFFTTSTTWEAFIYFFPYFGHAAQLMKSYFPDQGSNLPPAMKAPSPNPWTGREFPI